jgi:hypothetical protein
MEKKYVAPYSKKLLKEVDGVTVNYMHVWDLTKGKKLDIVSRTHLLKECLQGLDDELSKINTDGPDVVLIEYQMSANDKSRCVSNGIIYHYSCTNTKVVVVGPTLKNKICFSTDNTLEHGAFMAKYSKPYTANKNHTKANFLYWMDVRNIEVEFAKKNIDDIADAFMQIWGWLDYGIH